MSQLITILLFAAAIKISLNAIKLVSDIFFTTATVIAAGAIIAALSIFGGVYLFNILMHNL